MLKKAKRNILNFIIMILIIIWLIFSIFNSFITLKGILFVVGIFIIRGFLAITISLFSIFIEILLIYSIIRNNKWGKCLLIIYCLFNLFSRIFHHFCILFLKDKMLINYKIFAEIAKVDLNMLIMGDGSVFAFLWFTIPYLLLLIYIIYSKNIFINSRIL